MFSRIVLVLRSCVRVSCAFCILLKLTKSFLCRSIPKTMLYSLRSVFPTTPPESCPMAAWEHPCSLHWCWVGPNPSHWYSETARWAQKLRSNRFGFAFLCSSRDEEELWEISFKNLTLTKTDVIFSPAILSNSWGLVKAQQKEDVTVWSTLTTPLVWVGFSALCLFWRILNQITMW